MSPIPHQVNVSATGGTNGEKALNSDERRVSSNEYQSSDVFNQNNHPY